MDFEEFSQLYFQSKQEGMQAQLARAQHEASAQALGGDFDLRRAFALMDTDGSGALDSGEMFQGLLQLGMAQPEEELAIKQTVAELDADGSGR